jgi:hypothetical protein
MNNIEELLQRALHLERLIGEGSKELTANGIEHKILRHMIQLEDNNFNFEGDLGEFEFGARVADLEEECKDDDLVILANEKAMAVLQSTLDTFPDTDDESDEEENDFEV